jgi:glyoxylase-like metal-dependent hydrolase (beta-lactamase superfamily II)
MNRAECRKAMDAGLNALAVDLNRTDFFITHMHADHFGLVSDLAGESAKIYFNYPDARIVNEPNHWDQISAMALVNGTEFEDWFDEIAGREPEFNAPPESILLVLRTSLFGKMEAANAT